jgi:autotransporter-associated beta strand protein
LIKNGTLSVFAAFAFSPSAPAQAHAPDRESRVLRLVANTSFAGWNISLADSAAFSGTVSVAELLPFQPGDAILVGDAGPLTQTGTLSLPAGVTKISALFINNTNGSVTPDAGARIAFSGAGFRPALFALAATLAAAPALPARADENGGRTLFWTGADGGNWHGAWMAPDSTAASFSAGDTVCFDSIADASNPGSRAVTIGVPRVVVSGMIVSGAADYSFTGGAIIAGIAAVAPPGSVEAGGAPAFGRLTKTGAGRLTLATGGTNDFKGGVDLNAGTLVLGSRGALGGSSLTLSSAAATLEIAAGAGGVNLTGDVLLTGATAGLLTINTLGDAEISGRILGTQNAYGATGGRLAKTGAGTLTLSGSLNSFYQATGITISAGRLRVTAPGAVGGGNISIAAPGTLEFRGLPATVLPMAFTGGAGRIEIVDSDLTFSARTGGANLDANAQNAFAALALSGSSRLTAVAVGARDTVLGGAGAVITVGENSVLALKSGGVAVVAKTLALDGGALLLHPGASLAVSGGVTLAGGAKIAFAGAGVSRLAYGAGTDPSGFVYATPAGTTLAVNESAGARDFVVVNQGANPMRDLAMTARAATAVMDTVAGRLDADFLLPAADRRPARRRQWINTAWARWLASRFDFDSGNAARPGHTGDAGALVAGLDGDLGHRLLLGFYAGLGENNLATDNATDLRSRQNFLGVHAAQRIGAFYLAADISRGAAATRSFRREESGLTAGAWDNTLNGAGIEAGAVLDAGPATRVKPSAAVRHLRLKLSGFKESGPGAMRVDGFAGELVQGILGATASHRFNIHGRAAAADVSLGWKTALRAPRARLGAVFVSRPDIAVALESDDYYQDTVSAGLALRVALTRNTFAAAAGEYEAGPGQSRATAGLSVGCAW